MHVPLIFYFSHLSGISIAQKQLTCPKKLFWTSKNSYKGYFVETKQIKLTTASPTPNFECLTSNMSCLHPVKTYSFLRCTCLNTTDGIRTFINKIDCNLVITTTKHTKWHQWVLNRSIWQNSFFYCQAMKRFCVWEIVKRKNILKWTMQKCTFTSNRWLIQKNGTKSDS